MPRRKMNEGHPAVNSTAIASVASTIFHRQLRKIPLTTHARFGQQQRIPRFIIAGFGAPVDICLTAEVWHALSPRRAWTLAQTSSHALRGLRACHLSRDLQQLLNDRTWFRGGD